MMTMILIVYYKYISTLGYFVHIIYTEYKSKPIAHAHLTHAHFTYAYCARSDA